MDLNVRVNPVTGDQVMTFTLTQLDLREAPLDGVDLWILSSKKEPGYEISDQLMNAQLIAFRLEQKRYAWKENE